MTFDGRAPFSPAVVDGPSPDFLPAYLSNGVIGLRVREIPLLNGVAVLNGLAAQHPVVHVECTPHAPYPLGGDIRVGSMRMSDFFGCVRYIGQRYDFERGELTSHFSFHAQDATAEVTVLTFCSRTMPSIVLQRVEVTVDGPCELELSAKVDPRTVPGRWATRIVDMPGGESAPVDGALQWETLGALSRCGLAYSTTCVGFDQRRTAPDDEHSPLSTSYVFAADHGQPYVLTQLVSMVPSPAHDQPHLEAMRLVAAAAQRGFDRLRRDNSDAWHDLWRARPLLAGAGDRWQRLADAAFFYVNTSVHASSLASTHPFGLSQWHDYHYYYGHVMWDLEVFALPVLLFTQPGAARAMLDYRLRTLAGADQNARLNGWRGLQFPWEASPRYGQEAAPGGGAAAAHEHHVTPDIAVAFARYAHATGELDFETRDAWPVLKGAADWLASRVTRSERGFEIRQASGVAEREEVSDNSSYMNLMSKRCLEEAVALARRIGLDPPTEWSEIADGLVVPMDGSAIVDHDGFDPGEEKGSTPAALAAMFPGGYRPSPEVELTTLRYWLDMADDYVGAPMLSALYPTWAARAGDRALAARLAEEGYAAFNCERFMNLHEYREDRFPEQPVSGPFVANMAGFLMNCYLGLPGIEVSADDPTTWPRRPVVLPEGWDAIEVESIHVRGGRARLVARHGDDRARLELLD